MATTINLQKSYQQQFEFEQQLYSNPGAFAILKTKIGDTSAEFFTSDPDDLLDLAENATQLAHKLARQLQADEAARAVLATA
jgi:hypothetical protein